MSRPADPGRVHLRTDRPWAELVLDHPARRNAVTTSMVAALEAHVDTLAAAPPPAVLLWGAGGRAFCAGSDLRRVRESLDHSERAVALCRRMEAALARLEALPTLRVVAIEGAAVGGGAELALVGHRIFLADDAIFGLLHASLGVSPGWGGGRRLVGRVGPRRATLLLVEAARLSAAEALHHGVVDAVTPPGQAVAEARRWLARVTAHGAAVVQAAVRVGAGLSPAEEAATFAALWGGPAHRAALLGDG